MIRRAFLKRMAFAALASGLLGSELLERTPRLDQWEYVTLSDYDGMELWVAEYSREFLDRVNPPSRLVGIT